MRVRVLAVIIGLLLVSLAGALWRPELVGLTVDLGLGPLEAWRGAIAAGAALSGVAIAITIYWVTRDLEAQPSVVFIKARPVEPRELVMAGAHVPPSAEDITASLDSYGAEAETTPRATDSVDDGQSAAASTARLIAASVAAAEAAAAPVAAIRRPAAAPFPMPGRHRVAAAAARLPQWSSETTFEPGLLALASPPEPLPISLFTTPRSDQERNETYRDAIAAAEQLQAHGRIEAALAQFEVALGEARGAHAAAPGDVRASAELAGALTGTGDCHDQMGHLDAALAAHRESLGLRRMIAARAPEDRQALIGLSLGLERLAHSREREGHTTRALDLFRQRLPLAERLMAVYRGEEQLRRDASETRDRIAALEAKLS